jgi:hypothetical protein
MIGGETARDMLGEVSGGRTNAVEISLNARLTDLVPVHP